MTGSLTDVPGILVGHAEVPGGGSGCTAILGPFRGRVCVPGLASGTRELEVLRAEHVTRRIDALLLSGGSAFGLAAAQGIVEWLEERGQGHWTPNGIVPIVPGAILYDLAVGKPRPGPEEGRAACDAASDGPVPEGQVGAGAGATVGKFAGFDHAVPGGIGSASCQVDGYTVGALAAVNALGSVVGRDGKVMAGPDPDRTPLAIPSREGQNTTLCVVGTDAPLSPVDLGRVLTMAQTALARRIVPVHTPFDGDVVFGVTTAEDIRPWESPEVMSLGLGATRVLEDAILAAVGGAS